MDPSKPSDHDTIYIIILYFLITLVFTKVIGCTQKA